MAYNLRIKLLTKKWWNKNVFFCFWRIFYCNSFHCKCHQWKNYCSVIWQALFLFPLWPSVLLSVCLFVNLIIIFCLFVLLSVSLFSVLSNAPLPWTVCPYLPYNILPFSASLSLYTPPILPARPTLRVRVIAVLS